MPPTAEASMWSSSSHAPVWAAAIYLLIAAVVYAGEEHADIGQAPLRILSYASFQQLTCHFAVAQRGSPLELLTGFHQAWTCSAGLGVNEVCSCLLGTARSQLNAQCLGLLGVTNVTLGLPFEFVRWRVVRPA